jgi:hypothetical protein
MKRFVFIIVLLIIAVRVQAQSAFQTDLDSLSGYLFHLRQAKTPTEIELANAEFKNAVEKLLEKPEAFLADYSHLKTFGAVMSPDKEFRIFTWNAELPDGNHIYSAYVVKPGKNKNKVISLVDNFNLQTIGNETDVFDNKKWYGALYYEIIPVKGKNGTYYTLLGWDGNTSRSTRRILETMTISGSKVKFGVPAIRTAKGTVRRIVFEYNEEISMVMRNESRKKPHAVVFDHLSPKAPQLEGLWEQYVPDGSYDAIELDKQGVWQFISDFNATNKKELFSKPYNDPLTPENHVIENR